MTLRGVCAVLGIIHDCETIGIKGDGGVYVMSQHYITKHDMTGCVPAADLKLDQLLYGKGMWRGYCRSQVQLLPVDREG